MSSPFCGSSQRALPYHPPPYDSPPNPPPCYSQDPARDETRLDISPQRRRRQQPTGIFTKRSGPATVVLLDQDPDIRVPIYRRHGLVRGSLIIERGASRVCEIVAKLQGRIETTTTDSGVQSIKVFKNTYCLWSCDPSSAESSEFPGTVELACEFPATCQHDGRNEPLPPSYIVGFPGFPALFVRCQYSLHITITNTRRLGILPSATFVYIPIEYNPQTVPFRGLPSVLNFHSSVKLIPEEWYQTSCLISSCCSKVAPIQCESFIPSVRIFGLPDTIPIHLQFSGPLSSLRQLFLPTVGNDSPRLPVRAFLTRKVMYAYRGKATVRLLRIGEARFPPLPPLDLNCNCKLKCESCDVCASTFNWDGEIKCDETVTVGGFSVGGLNVKDYISLIITPSRNSSLLGVQHEIPVRFVTESYVEPD
ncbi:hypothetical protein R3P38DRAFT_1873638 [Favolaschia claudopus]|uniref:Arrestin-like N-terminal domain-containing protein n=1 Tax=Favolaschia claudopus TaxID=2862362 RepID=A0AAW0D7D4_9AGAR